MPSTGLRGSTRGRGTWLPVDGGGDSASEAVETPCWVQGGGAEPRSAACCPAPSPPGGSALGKGEGGRGNVKLTAWSGLSAGPVECEVLQERGRARSAAASDASVGSELFPAMLSACPVTRDGGPALRDKLRKGNLKVTQHRASNASVSL